MASSAPSLEVACLQELRRALAGQPLPWPEDWLARVQAGRLVEEAAEVLRSYHHRPLEAPLVENLTRCLMPLVAGARAKRGAFHHLDSARVTIRFHFSKQIPAVDFEDRDLHAIFLCALRLEGLIVSLDLGKRPRPVLRSDLPLPAGVAGLDESMDVELRAEPADPAGDLLERLQRRLPEGLKIQQWEVIPNHASGLGERALVSHWRWACPSILWASAQQAVTTSDAGAEGFFLEMAWVGDTLVFSTRMGPFLATNPVKQLAVRLGLAPSEVVGLLRVRVELRPDPRLNQPDRFASKLKNLYEDAVLLGGGSNITLVEDEDDEPIRLG